MNTFTQRRLGLFGVVALVAAAVLVPNVAAAGAATPTTELQRAPFVAAGSPPAPTPGDGGSIVAIGPVVAAVNPVLARAPFVAVPIARTPAFGSDAAGVAGASALAAAGGFERAALGAPVPGPLVLNATPISATAGLSILGGSLLAMILIGGATVLLASDRSRPQVERGSAGSVTRLAQRQPEKPAETDKSSRRRAA